MKNKVISAEQAISLIKNGDTVSTSGFLAAGHPEEVSQTAEKMFLETGQPNNLVLFYGASQAHPGDNVGLNHWVHEGMVKRLIGSHYNLQRNMIPLISANKVEAYCYPLGVCMQLFRAMASKTPGLLSKVGLKTFIDPRVEGGRMNSISQETFVELMEIDGQEYLWYKAHKINVAIIRGTYADEEGNISDEDEAVRVDTLNLAMAAKASGGIVIAEVKALVQAGTIPPHKVEVPAMLVDYIVISKPENHRQTYTYQFNPACVGAIKQPMGNISPLPLDARKIVCRRAALELVPNAVINLGIGMPEGVSSVAAEEDILNYLTYSVEAGPVGGMPLPGPAFGASVNPEALMCMTSKLDFYDGGGIDLACLGMAELDAQGNVNVSKFGPKVPGVGGFMNVSANAKKLVFCGTMTASGLQIAVRNSGLEIVQEGSARKVISKVGQITYSGEYARESGLSVLYVTERAVFQMRTEGLTLIEIAPGVDLQKDILDQMDFEPRISENLQLMDMRIFRPEPMGLKAEIEAKAEA